MKRLTKVQKEKLAFEILDLLKEYDLQNDLRIYFGNKYITENREVCDCEKASHYFECANDDTLSMSFEGGFYEVVNYYSPLADVVLPKFSKLLESYGLYYELGEAWNLAMYYIDYSLAKSV